MFHVSRRRLLTGHVKPLSDKTNRSESQCGSVDGTVLVYGGE